MEAREFAGGTILAEVSNRIGTITFNQPEKHNALSGGMWEAVEEILDTWRDDDSVRVVVLTGAGDKAFISRSDIGEFESRHDSFDASREYNRLSGSEKEKLNEFPKPVIASIRGYCLGSGLGIAIHADIRIAAEDSQFGIPAARIGLAYGFSSIKRLVDLVGPAHAAMILYSAERIGSAEALRIGLVNQVVPGSDLETAVQNLARKIASNAPFSVRASKMTIEQALRDPDRRDLKGIERAGIECLTSEDHREGRAGFHEKRPPVFRGS
ncbi:MAG TPA: enoyl-CoA hydratase [Bryobacteraceae bacterium]|jgi:enoyl-CoA hydratase/carnithine racemase|nr:enoyl-CoA hydratase [Bryobacteraceae bacterium]